MQSSRPAFADVRIRSTNMLKTHFLTLAILMTAQAMFLFGPCVAIAQESVIWKFGAGTDGTTPLAGLISDSAGNLYGTTSTGGTTETGSNAGYGTVFELSPVSGGTWKEKTLYSFGTNSLDAVNPGSSLTFDTSGNLYGTSTNGGIYDYGTVFELSPVSGGTWKEKVLYNFGEYNGSPDQPEGALTIDGKGNLYGATGAGGTDQNGVVFELSPGSGGAWSFNVLWNFQSGTTFQFGASGKLIFDANGSLYGTTTNGGTEAVCGCGTVFELSPATGGTWTEKIIYAFGGANSRDGATPNSDLIFDTHGNLYGTTFHGGVYDSGNGGTAFELSPTSGGWSETVLWSFGNTGDGFNPGGGLIIDSQGNLYGSTSTGPASLSDGNVFELSPTGGGSWSEKILHTFGSTSSDGIEPFGSLLADAAGNLYGTTESGGYNDGSNNTSGTVFEIAGAIKMPGVTLSATSLAFGSEAVGSSTASQSVTMTNSNSTALTISSIEVTGADASSYAFANTCGSSLAAGANCTIHGHFGPTTTGSLPATITITDSAANSPQSISLSGTGTSGQKTVSLSAASLAFGSEAVGSSTASQSVTLNNSGSSTVTISSIAVTGAGASSFAFANSCGSGLAAGATCTIHGHFTPTTTGAISAAITITDNATGSPQTISLSGTGGGPGVTLSATSLAFGSVAVGSSTASQSVTLTNSGNSPITFTSISVTGTDASSFAFGTTCASGLAASGTCTIHGHFAPTTTGALTAAVTIKDNAGSSPQSIALSGTGH